MTPDQGERHSGEAITIERIEPYGERRGIELLTTAQDSEGRLAATHSAYGDNRSPPLTWTPVAEAMSYALVVEDPDAPHPKPFVHWMLWNIPGDVSALPEGIPSGPLAARPGGAIQGRNDMGSYGWFGPQPPHGHGVHRYYFQIFALSQRLDMGPDTPLEDLVNALKASALAEGRLVATFEAPTEQ